MISQYKGATVRLVDAAMAREVYDVRLLLEPEALRRSITRKSSLEACRKTLERADTAIDEADRSLSQPQLHRALYVPCGNPLLPDARRDP